VAEQLLEAGDVAIRTGQDQAAGIELAVELFGDLGRVLQVAAGDAGLMALVASLRPAAGLVQLNLFAQVAFDRLQNAHVEDVEPGALGINMNDAVAFVGVDQRGKLAHVGPEVGED